MTNHPTPIAVATPRPNGKNQLEDLSRALSTDSLEGEPLVIEAPSSRRRLKKTPKSMKDLPSGKGTPSSKSASSSSTSTPVKNSPGRSPSSGKSTPSKKSTSPGKGTTSGKGTEVGKNTSSGKGTPSEKGVTADKSRPFVKGSPSSLSARKGDHRDDPEKLRKVDKDGEPLSNSSRRSGYGFPRSTSRGSKGHSRSLSRGQTLSSESLNDEVEKTGAEAGGRVMKGGGFHKFKRIPSMPRKPLDNNRDGSTTEEDVDISELERL